MSALRRPSPNNLLSTSCTRVKVRVFRSLLLPGRHSARVCCSSLRPMRQRPFRPNEVTGVAVGIFFEIILMLGLGLPERSSRGHLRDNLARPKARSIDIGEGIFRGPRLRVAGIEDGRPIARAPVVALAVQRRGIMDLEKELQQLAIADALRIEGDLNGLGVIAMVAI